MSFRQPRRDEDLLARLDALVDGLDTLLLAQGYDPATSRPA